MNSPVFPSLMTSTVQWCNLQGTTVNQKEPGMYKVLWSLISFPPCLWFSSPRRVASRYKMYDFLPHIAIKQCFYGLNSVKLCFTNHFLWFGTVKSFIFPKFSFFLFFSPWIFSPITKPFDYFPPPTGGGNVEQYTGLNYR